MEHSEAQQKAINTIDEEALDSLVEESKLINRIGNNTINLTNYNKHDQQKSSRITGKALLNNMVKNLSVIDIDINKELDNDTKENIRNNILSKLSDNDIIVKTAYGGLHIYANTDDFVTTNNRMIKCYKSNEFDIDIFNCYDKTNTHTHRPGCLGLRPAP